MASIHAEQQQTSEAEKEASNERLGKDKHQSGISMKREEKEGKKGYDGKRKEGDVEMQLRERMLVNARCCRPFDVVPM